MKQLLVKIVVPKLKGITLLATRKGVQLEPLHLLLAPTFSPKFRAELNYHIAVKHSKATSRFVHKNKVYDKDFHSFYLLRKEHGAQIGSRAEDAYVAQLIRDVDDNSLKEELESCKHFLVDSKIENGRHCSATLPWILRTQNICWKS